MAKSPYTAEAYQKAIRSDLNDHKNFMKLVTIFRRLLKVNRSTRTVKL